MDKSKAFALIIIAMAFAYNWHSRRAGNEKDTKEIETRYIDDFIDDDLRFRLQSVFESMQFYQAQSNWSAINDIGEAESVNPTTNECDSPYLILNKNENLCQLPVRIDVAAHYIKYGGYFGLKESAEKLISRMVYFVEYSFDPTQLKEFVEIFESPQFIDNTKSVCRGYTNNQEKNFVLRQYQANFIVQIPGMNIPMHFDVPYFKGASRHLYPKWFLIVMERSGLFEDRRIPSVQIVTYLHNVNGTNPKLRGGEFVYWNKGIYNKPDSIPCKPNSAVFADGSLIVHETTALYPKNTHYPLMFGKDERVYIKFDKTDKKWKLYDEKTNKRIYENEAFSWNEVRVSIPWRAWCFENENEAKLYDPYTVEKGFELEDILLILKQDLAKRWNWSLERIEEMDKLDFVLAMIDEYIHYPLNARIISFNYCAVFRFLDARYPTWKPAFSSIQNAIGCY